MTDTIFIVGLIVVLSWWHREPWGYLFSAFSLIAFALQYSGVFPDMNKSLSVLIVAFAVLNVFKAMWDRGPKKAKGQAQ
jgi:hypothetical protein